MPQKLFFCIVCSLCTCVQLFAQHSPKADSLKVLLQKKVEANTRLEIYLELAQIYQKSKNDFPQAQEYAEKALHLAHQLNSSQGLSRSQALFGHIAFDTSNFHQALRSFEIARAYAIKTRDTLQWIDMHNQMGRCMRNLGDFDKALRYFKESYALLEKTSDHNLLGNTYELIAGIYSRRGLYNQAEEYYKKALKCYQSLGEKEKYIYCKMHLAIGYAFQGKFYEYLSIYQTALAYAQDKNDEPAMALIYNNLAHIYKDLEDYSTSLQNARRAESLYIKVNNTHDLSITLGQIGLCYFELGNYPKALKNTLSGKNLAEKLNFKRGIIDNYIVLGRIYLAQENYEEARNYLEKSLKMARELNDRNSQVEALIFLGRAHFQLQEYPKALKYLEESTQFIPKTEYFRHYQLLPVYLSETYAALGDFTAAYKASRMYKEILDSLHLYQNTRKFTLKEAQQQFKEEKKNIFQKRKKERARLRSEIFLRRKSTFWLVISVIVTAFILIAYWIKLKSNRALTKLNLEINQQHQKIKAQNENLERLVQSKDRFYSIISHDLRGPAHSLSSLSTILNRSLEEEDIPEMKSLVPLIEDTSRHIAQLLDNLLTWAHQQQGLIQTKPESILLNDCVKEVFALYQMEAEVKKIALIQASPDPIFTWADRNGILSILRNLIGNAIKFSKEGGKVQVSLRQANEQALIEVADSGIGISEDKLFKIIHEREPHSSRGTRGEKGSGLGLLLVQDFVEMNQGKMEARSSLGKGTCFRIYLPISS